MGLPQANEGNSGQASLSILEKLGLLEDLQSEFAKAINEQENIKQRHRRELADVIARRKEYADAIITAMRELNAPTLLEEEPATQLLVTSPSSTQPEGETKHTNEIEQRSQQNQLNKDEDEQEKELPVEQLATPKFEKRGVLKMAVLQVFAEQDSFLTADDVIDLIKKRFPNNGLTRAQITDSLKDARRSAIVGHRTYQGRLPIYLNGLPTFYSNVERKEIKPEYVDKYLERMIELGLSETIEPTTDEQLDTNAKAPSASLFSVAAEGTEQKNGPR